MRYAEGEIRRIAHVAFQAAQKRNKRLTSVDKANVLETFQFWKDIVTDVHKEYPDVALDHICTLTMRRCSWCVRRRNSM